MNKNEIIERIARARNMANLSARKLSQRIEMKDAYINRLESKKDFLPSLEVLIKIVNECGLTLSQFFYYDMAEYNNDIKIIEKLKNLNNEQKTAILTIIDNMK